VSQKTEDRASRPRSLGISGESTGGHQSVAVPGYVFVLSLYNGTEGSVRESEFKICFLMGVYTQYLMGTSSVESRKHHLPFLLYSSLFPL
jgi:hypothetical protein